jgi:tetratricopeptide (TPR) repeat protein
MLGEFYWTRFKIGELAEDLRKAITHYDVLFDRFASMLPPKIREFLEEIEARLERAEELMDRAAYPGGDAMLDEAIAILREIAQLTVDGHPALPTAYTGLAVALERRFNLRGRVLLVDLDDAFEAIDRAIQLSRPDDERLLTRRTFRIRFLVTKYNQSDDVAILEEAIRSGREVLTSVPPDKPVPIDLNAAMAQLYTRRYDRMMAIADIDAAIGHLRHAVNSSSEEENELERGELMDDLGVALRRRGEHVGDTETLAEAVEWHLRAVDAYPVAHIDRLMVRRNLARALLALGEAPEARDGSPKPPASCGRLSLERRIGRILTSSVSSRTWLLP